MEVVSCNVPSVHLTLHPAPAKRARFAVRREPVAHRRLRVVVGPPNPSSTIEPRGIRSTLRLEDLHTFGVLSASEFRTRATTPMAMNASPIYQNARVPLIPTARHAIPSTKKTGTPCRVSLLTAPLLLPPWPQRRHHRSCQQAHPNHLGRPAKQRCPQEADRGLRPLHGSRRRPRSRLLRVRHGDRASVLPGVDGTGS